MGYFRATGYFYDLAAKMEAELFEPDFRPADTARAFARAVPLNSYTVLERGDGGYGSG